MPTETGKRCLLVTGASGFIGQNFVQAARAQGDDVRRLVRDPQQAAPDAIVFDADTAVLGAALAQAGCDAIIHCAAAYSPADAPEQTATLVEANMVFSLAVLQSGRVAGIDKFLNLGTLWEHSSTGAVQPVNLYAQLKLAFQGCLDYFGRAQGLRAITLKLADTYGEDDTRGKLMSLLRDSARAGTPLQMTSGYQIINPVHVADVCGAMLMAVARLFQDAPAGHAAYIVDGDAPCTVRDLVARAQALWPVPLDVAFGAVDIDGHKPLEIWTDGPRLPGWSPQISQSEGLMRMAP